MPCVPSTIHARSVIHAHWKCYVNNEVTILSICNQTAGQCNMCNGVSVAPFPMQPPSDTNCDTHCSDLALFGSPESDGLQSPPAPSSTVRTLNKYDSILSKS